jgi:PAS domain-containing protein
MHGSKTTQNSEQLSRMVLDALPAAIYTTDAAGKITYFNQAAVEMAGRTPEPGDEWCVTWRLYMPDGTPLAHDQCPMAVALREQRSPNGLTVRAFLLCLFPRRCETRAAP